MDNVKNIVKSKKTEKKENNVVRPIYFVLFIVMLILLSIAYASLAINLGVKINGVKDVESLNWNVHFNNIQVDKGSVNPIKAATIDDNKTKITYEVYLSTPGEYYLFTADIVNSGTIDAKIYDIIENGITNNQKRYLDYYVRYANGAEILKDDPLDAGATKKVEVLVKFKDDLEPGDLPNTATDLNLSYQIVYVEK